MLAWIARVQFASRCGGGRSIQPHHCAPFRKRCTMARSSRPSATTTAPNSHARAIHATRCSHEARACDLRTAVVAENRFDRIIAHRFKTVHNDAVESIVRRCNGSLIARSRAPRARPFSGAR
eukprot:10761342-Lingulodinium_polyedra.AAC.1